MEKNKNVINENVIQELDVEKTTAKFINQFSEELKKTDSYEGYYQLIISKLVSSNIIVGDFLANSDVDGEELGNLMDQIEKLSDHITEVYIAKYLSGKKVEFSDVN